MYNAGRDKTTNRKKSYLFIAVNTMKTLILLFSLCCCAACNQNGSEQAPATMSGETARMITATEDSLRKMDEMMNRDTGMPMTKKMDMMHQRAGWIEKNTDLLLRDTMMVMDAAMKKLKDSLAMMDKHMETGKMSADDAMKMLKEKNNMLVQQWMKTKAMKQQAEEIKQIASTKMNSKNR